jgi:hypothetical protein
MDDLYIAFRDKLRREIPAIHPQRWLLREFRLGPLSTGFMSYRFADQGILGQSAVPTGPVFCLGGREFANFDEARKTLVKMQRESRAGVYLAHPLVARQYELEMPTGVALQNAAKDFLKEIQPSLDLKSTHLPAR